MSVRANEASVAGRTTCLLWAVREPSMCHLNSNWTALVAARADTPHTKYASVPTKSGRIVTLTSNGGTPIGLGVVGFDVVGFGVVGFGVVGFGVAGLDVVGFGVVGFGVVGFGVVGFGVVGFGVAGLDVVGFGVVGFGVVGFGVVGFGVVGFGVAGLDVVDDGDDGFGLPVVCTGSVIEGLVESGVLVGYSEMI